MKHLLVILVACLSFAFIATAQQPDTPSPAPDGKPGVENGTCWKNSSGNLVSVKLGGGVHGDYRVTLTEDGKTGKGWGKPDFDGGIVKTNSTIDVGEETYRAKDGGMEWENDAGKWIKLTKVECKKEAGRR